MGLELVSDAEIKKLCTDRSHISTAAVAKWVSTLGVAATIVVGDDGTTYLDNRLDNAAGSGSAAAALCLFKSANMRSIWLDSSFSISKFKPREP